MNDELLAWLDKVLADQDSVFWRSVRSLHGAGTDYWVQPCDPEPDAIVEATDDLR